MNVGLISSRISNSLIITIMGFFFALSIIFIIRSLTSYDNKYEHLKFSYSNKLYKDYLKAVCKKSSNTSLIYIYFHNESNDYEKENIIKKILTNLYNRYSGIKGIKVFRVDNQSQSMCINNYDLLEEVSDDLKQLLNEEQTKYNKFRSIISTTVIVDSITLFDSYDELEILLKNYCSQKDSYSVETAIIHFDEKIISSLQKEIEVSNELDYVINNDNVEIILQPIYSIKDNKFVSAEAFMSLRDSNGEIMKPGSFIPIALKYNKLKNLGACVIKKVCKYYEILNNNNIELDHIFINVSGNELEDTDYTNMIIDEISKSKISVDKIAIELNNVESIKHRELFLKNVNSIRLFGLPIAISGFGGIDSRIDEIISLPVDILKLDVSIILRANKDERAFNVVSGIFDLANKLNMQTIAVGVESEEQANNMIKLGVNYIQGRYYSGSLTQSEFIITMNKVKGTN